MTFKINERVLSIPPYISTDWGQIGALHLKGEILVILLKDRHAIEIPHLDSKTIQLVFQFHALHLEKDQGASVLPTDLELSKLKKIIDQGEPSIRLAISSSLDGLSNMMQHNPAQANSPDLPHEILQKIAAIAKIITPADELLSKPKGEPNCNCFHCQIARVINPPSGSSVEETEISLDELQFQQWNIVQTGDRLFSVINRLDEHEKYSVYLGEPLGCTCGKQGCEHILAVLKT